MSRIVKMIEELCPEGVEYKELGEVCISVSAGGDLPENYKKGQVFPSVEFPYPIYSNGCDDKALYGFTDNYKIDSDAITISARGTIGFHTIREAKYTPIVRLISLIPNKELITAKFLNYILDLTPIAGTNGGIPQLTVPNVKKISIPIPPLPVQQEIVTILDTFTELDAELQAELEARRKQYEHYRNELLNFEGNSVQRYNLVKIAQVINGRAYSRPELLSEGKYKVLRVGNFFTNDNWYYSNLELEENKYCDNGDLLYAWSASFGPKLWNGSKVIYHYHIWKIECCKIINKKYLYYWLQSEDMAIQAFSKKHGATMAHLTKDKMEKLIVPLPPLAEQERIVGILDKFEALVSDELPAEIAARRKQYEYYREKLLTFEPLTTNH